MLHAKTCHQGLRPRSRLLGLEAIDALLLFPPVFVCTVLLDELLLGAASALGLGVVLYLLKLGRLPGHSSALLQFFAFHPFSAALGYDRAPRYPRTKD